jgi:hypothetical protein
VIVVPRCAARIARQAGRVPGDVLARDALIGVGRDVIRVLPVARLGVLQGRSKRIRVAQRRLVGAATERDEIRPEVTEAVVRAAILDDVRGAPQIPRVRAPVNARYIRWNAAICCAGRRRRRASSNSDCLPVSLPAAARVSPTRFQNAAASIACAAGAVVAFARGTDPARPATGDSWRASVTSSDARLEPSPYAPATPTTTMARRSMEIQARGTHPGNRLWCAPSTAGRAHPTRRPYQRLDRRFLSSEH